jgi:tetratricopeptide (TPR) repeat protein
MNTLLVLSALAFAQASAAEVHDHAGHGKVAFQTTCSPAAQATFLEGVAWLHSFEYEEAGKSFNAAASADPSCAIANWGTAMSLYHPLWAAPNAAELKRGRDAVARAQATPAKSERERAYVDAVAAFYRDSESLDHKTRAEAYSSAMRDLHRRYPQDLEAGTFYALTLIAAGTLDDDQAFAKEREAATILNAVMEAQPDHPGVAHYLIHSFDYPPLAELALPAAKRYAGIAPASPHAQHMPSHIFTRLGMWSDSISSNLMSAAAAREAVKSKGFEGASREELHAMDYLAYAYLQTGQDKAAEGVLAHLNTMQRVDDPIFSVAYAATAIPARLALERRQWREAAALAIPENVRRLVPLENFSWGDAHIHFARAVGAARSGDAAAARQEIAKLSAIEQALSIPPGTYDWRAPVGVQRRIAAAWLAHSEGKQDEALDLMRQAAALDDITEKHPVTPGAILPAREQLGELLLELGQGKEALTAFEASLKRSPQRLNGLYGAARAARLAGETAKAREYQAALVELTRGGDQTRAELKDIRLSLAD